MLASEEGLCSMELGSGARFLIGETALRIPVEYSRVLFLTFTVLWSALLHISQKFPASNHCLDMGYLIRKWVSSQHFPRHSPFATHTQVTAI